MNSEDFTKGLEYVSRMPFCWPNDPHTHPNAGSYSYSYGDFDIHTHAPFPYTRKRWGRCIVGLAIRRTDDVWFYMLKRVECQGYRESDWVSLIHESKRQILEDLGYFDESLLGVPLRKL